MADSDHTPERRSAKSKVCYTRSLTVRKGTCSRIKKDKDHAHFDKTIYSSVPWINIRGQWLEKAGFPIDTPITVRIMDGCLVLTVKEPET